MKKLFTYIFTICIFCLSFGVNNSHAAVAECAIGFDSDSITLGEGTALWWWTSGAKSATIDNGIGDIRVPSDWKWIYPTGTTRDFTITVVGIDDQVVTCKATINIKQTQVGPECYIGLDPENIKKGDGTALWWWTSGAVSGSINNGIGSVEVPSDWKWIEPEKTTTYTLSLTGPNGGTSTCSTTVTVEDINPIGKKPVIFVMDDPQYDWLEQVSVDVTNIHINENVDITLDVVPVNLSQSTILGPNLKAWYKNKRNLVQIAQHGYTHTEEEYSMNTLSYAKQAEIVGKGRNEFAKLGIFVTSFTPPGGAQSNTTLKVLSDYNFLTLLDWWTGLKSTEDILVVKQSGVELCQGEDNSGVNCKFKSSATIQDELDSEIAANGYSVVVSHMQDFANATGTKDTVKITAYKKLLNNLKNSNKYDFMTVEEFHGMVR